MDIQTVPGIGYDSNTYLIMDTSWVLVDAGTGENLNTMAESVLKRNGLERVDRIVLTHTHYDHAGGARKLGELANADIFVHPSEGERLSAGDFDVTLSSMFGARMNPFNWSPLRDGDIIDTGSAKFKTLHLPGHSEGSIGLWEAESGSLIIGDTIFADGGIGRYDLPSSSLKQLRESIERISKLDVKNLFPGHGRSVLGDGAEHVRRSLALIHGGML